jgi:hypothetical protein
MFTYSSITGDRPRKEDRARPIAVYAPYEKAVTVCHHITVAEARTLAAELTRAANETEAAEAILARRDEIEARIQAELAAGNAMQEAA